MSYSKEKSLAELPYGAMITKILSTFNIDTQGGKVISANKIIHYTSLWDMKIEIKYKKLRDDWTTEEEEEDPKETEGTNNNQVWEIYQSIIKDMKDMKKMISRNDDTYDNE